MARQNLKFDKTNTLSSTSKVKKTNANNSNNSNTHIVGIRIATKSANTKEKVYYYRTNQDLKKGEHIRIRVPSGGTPLSTIAVENSNKNKNVKNLIIEK